VALGIVLTVLSYVVVLFFVVLIARAMLDWVQFFARNWRPKGAVLVAAEVVYTVTDPPLKLLRRLIPPLRLGAMSLDTAYLVLFVICMVLMAFL